MTHQAPAHVDQSYLSKRPDAVSLAIVIGHLILVVSPVYIAAAVGPGWILAGCWLFLGFSMNGVLNLMHECAHYHVFTRKKWSDILAKRIIAPFVFADFDGYRARHWEHHKFVGVEGETKDTYLIDIRGAGLLKMLVRCALMTEAAKKFFRQTVERTTPGSQSRVWLLNILVFQFMFGLSLLLTAWVFNQSKGWPAAWYYAAVSYGAIYLYSLMSLTIFMAALRAIAEHQQYEDHAVERGYAALRNFRCNPVSRYLMGAYGFGEHYTHHCMPAIPYYRLKAATMKMAEEDATLRPGKDYFRVLAEIVTQ